MSYSGSNAHELTARLLAALDSNHDVVDVHAVNEIISVLEKMHITKELLESTRLGKHVNTLRRSAKDPALARRAKVLVKRWRDLVIPTAANAAGSHSNRASVERNSRPLTSPALTRQVVSPIVASPKSSSRPGWSGYDSDSNDVILLDDEPEVERRPPTLAHTPTLAIRRSISPSPMPDAKRAKKPKRKRGHSRAGSGAEGAESAWAARNGGGAAPPAPVAPVARKNGCKVPVDAYAKLMHSMPAAGAKKVKTTRELLEAIQSRGASAASPARAQSPGSPEVLLVDSPVAVDSPPPSPLRNGGDSPAPPATPPAPPAPEPVYPLCTCSEDDVDEHCEAAVTHRPTPRAVWALHHAHVPDVNGTRAAREPHPLAVRPAALPGGALFASVVPLYKYLDHADDYCSKNQSRVDLCPYLPYIEFAPSPPPPPPAPSPPPPRPYPVDTPPPVKTEPDDECDRLTNCTETREQSDKCEEPISDKCGNSVNNIDECAKDNCVDAIEIDAPSETERARTSDKCAGDVISDKCDIDGRTLLEYCDRACRAASLGYSRSFTAPLVPYSCDEETAEELFRKAESETVRDGLGRPVRCDKFAEWHEPARLTDGLIALPYVVID